MIIKWIEWMCGFCFVVMVFFLYCDLLMGIVNRSFSLSCVSVSVCHVCVLQCVYVCIIRSHSLFFVVFIEMR